MARLDRWLILLLILVAGALGAFAIYTFGWHQRHEATTRSVRSQLAVQRGLAIRLQKTVHKEASFLSDICGGYRAFRDPAYTQTADRDVRYLVAVMRSFAVTCDQDGVR